MDLQPVRSFFLSITHTHTHTCSLAHTHTHALPPPHTNTHTHALSHIHTHALSLSHTHTKCSPSLTRTYTLTLLLNLSHTLSLSLSLSQDNAKTHHDKRKQHVCKRIEWKFPRNKKPPLSSFYRCDKKSGIRHLSFWSYFASNSIQSNLLLFQVEVVLWCYIGSFSMPNFRLKSYCYFLHIRTGHLHFCWSGWYKTLKINRMCTLK